MQGKINPLYLTQAKEKVKEELLLGKTQKSEDTEITTLPEEHDKN